MPQQLLALAGVTFLLSNAIADILVQPGYGQPHPVVQPHSTIEYAVGKQRNTLEPKQSSESNVYGVDQLPALLHQQSVPYHVEIQPVYLSQDQALQQVVGIPLHHHLLPFLPLRTRLLPHKRLHLSKLGGLGHLHLLGQPHEESTVHNRCRRTANDESGFGIKAAGYDKYDVAAEPTLRNGRSPVVDVQNQDEQAEVDRSRNDQRKMEANLHNVNLPKMYPNHNVPQPTIAIENSMPQNSGLSTEEKSTQNSPNQLNNESSGNHGLVSQTNHENTQHVSLKIAIPQDPSIRKNLEAARNLQVTLKDTTRSNSVESSRDDQSDSRASDRTAEWNESTRFNLLSNDNMEYQPVQRNFPDPRPLPSSLPSSKPKIHRQQNQPRTSEPKVAAQTIVPTENEHHESTKSNDNTETYSEETEGSYASNSRSHELPSNPVYTLCFYISSDKYPYTMAPYYALYRNNDETFANEGVMKDVTPEATQVYRTSRASEANYYLPSQNYIILPNDYNAYGVDYDPEYANIRTYRMVYQV